MARIRSIKPEFFTDEDLCSLPPLVRLLFIGIWTEADKAGRLKDKPGTIKMRCLPYDNLNVEKALEQLAEARFIIRYRVDGVGYIQVRTWDEHQRPHHTERESIYPSLLEGEVTVKEPSNNRVVKVTQKDEPSFPFLSIPFPSSLGSERMRAAWADWVRHRIEIKKPLTEQQVRKQLKQFDEWGEDRSVAAIEHTVRQGWQGLREPDKTTMDARQQRLAELDRQLDEMASEEPESPSEEVPYGDPY